MSRWTTILSVLGVGLGLVACSDVGFDSVPKRSCSDPDLANDVICKPNEYTNTYSFSFRLGEVDILFVNDNSGSMYVEQSKMATAFPNFFSSVSNLLFNIAIVTTDVSATAGNSTPRAANGNGAFQDGKFLEFTDEQGNKSGEYVLTKDSANIESKFRGTMKRKETLTCDQNGYKAEFCPSGDERGIYALNLAVERGGKFFRSGAPLAVVILSDEDERTGGGSTAGYPLEAKDLPETFVANMKAKYPTKAVSVHAVIVRPGDSSCLAQQTQYPSGGGYPTYGKYGAQYAKLANPTADLMALGGLVPGVMGSICTNDFGSQMGDIGINVRDNTLDSPRQLECVPLDGSVQITTSPAGYQNQIQYNIDDRGRVYFSNVPLGVQVNFTYDCERY